MCHDTPHISLISAQFARGSKQQGSIFDNCDKYLPEMLVLDEAHSARVSSDISGKKKKTLMYEMLEKVSSKIPHLILATATPMQKEASEYHSLLKLLGLPNLWLKDRNYDTSLRLLSSNGPPDLSDAYNAYLLIKSTINQMSPDLRSLTTEEKKLLEQLISDDSNIDRSHRGQLICHNWETFRNIFIKLHPAHLLTVRNTRRSLESIGYSFPKRNLINVSIDDSLDIEMFYKKVNDYLSNNCFQIEQALYPDRAISIGFVRTSYRQRVASSLFSCKYSLKRRLEKVQQIKGWISSGNLSNISNNADLADADSFDADDLMFRDVDNIENNNSVSIDYRQLLRSANLEETELTSLIKGASDILKQKGDPKIKYAIQLVEDYISDGKTVLVFSRYTDTISALLDAFSAHPLTNNLEYGIYTGQQCSIVKHGIASTSDKTELKNHLFSHEMSIVFCSDAASEGLNLQAAQVLINVDVPWTPSRLEQRIGRIARLGQKAKEVDICNIWYPNSIEARMYKRIQTRLEVTNMAVGEFPQVVADEIVAAVLEDREDSLSINSSLNKIRTCTQIDALELIWNRDTGFSYSDQTRKLMITIAEKEVNHKKQDDIIEFMLPSGKHVCLSPETGVPETVSLHSKIWDYIKLAESNIDIIKDKNGFPCAFSVKDEPSKRIYLCGVLKRCLNISTDESDYYIDMPSSLPNIMSLHTITDPNMDYSDKPELWI